MINQKNLVVTKREYECLFWLSNGLTAKEIAREMNISSRTIESYMKKIRYKTNLHRRSHIISFFWKIWSIDRNKMIELENISASSKGFFRGDPQNSDSVLSYSS